MSWNYIKPIVENEIAKADITNKAFIKLLMTYRRRVNTCQNMGYNHSWDYVCNSSAFCDAYLALDDIKTDHYDLWKQYCVANGYCVTADLGDWLA